MICFARRKLLWPASASVALHVHGRYQIFSHFQHTNLAFDVRRDQLSLRVRPGEIERDHRELGEQRTIVANQRGDFALGVDLRVRLELWRARARCFLDLERLADFSKQGMDANLAGTGQKKQFHKHSLLWGRQRNAVTRR
ncbi:hypothetical protein D3C86_1719570 [compost metagenome]